MPAITLNVGPELFHFETFRDWTLNAASRFARHGVKDRDVVCIDSLGRVCRIGRDFDRAENDGAFPVVVYSTECVDYWMEERK